MSSKNFLEIVYPEGPWDLTAIQPNRQGIDTKIFSPKRSDTWKQEAQGFIDKYNGKWNLYWGVNPPREEQWEKVEQRKKAERTDIKSFNFLHVDLDPRPGEDLEEERERILKKLTTKLPKGVPEPSMIIFSGGGYQGFWKLKEPILLDGSEEMAEAVKLYNLQLEINFFADNTHNIDRKGNDNFDLITFDLTSFTKAPPVKMKTGGAALSSQAISVMVPDLEIARKLWTDNFYDVQWENAEFDGQYEEDPGLY